MTPIKVKDMKMGDLLSSDWDQSPGAKQTWTYLVFAVSSSEDEEAHILCIDTFDIFDIHCDHRPLLLVARLG